MLVTQSCLTLCNSVDCSLPGSSVHGILQARILEQVAIPFSRGSSWPRDQIHVSHSVSKFLTMWATREAKNNGTPRKLNIHSKSSLLGINTLISLIPWYCYFYCGCCYLVTKSCPTLLQPHVLYPIRLRCPWNFPGKNTGVGCHFLL